MLAPSGGIVDVTAIACACCHFVVYLVERCAEQHSLCVPLRPPDARAWLCVGIVRESDVRAREVVEMRSSMDPDALAALASARVQVKILLEPDSCFHWALGGP